MRLISYSLAAFLLLGSASLHAGNCPDNVYYKNGSLAKWGATLYYSGGRLLKTGNALYYANGSLLKNNDTLYYKEGRLLKAGDNLYYYKDQRLLKSGKHFYYADGRILTDGSTYYHSNGRIARWGKTLYREDGSITQFPVRLQSKVDTLGELRFVVSSEEVKVELDLALEDADSVRIRSNEVLNDDLLLKVQINSGKDGESLTLAIGNDSMACELNAGETFEIDHDKAQLKVIVAPGVNVDDVRGALQKALDSIR